MYRRVIRSLFVAAALLLTTTACDKGGDAGAERGKSADAGKQADDSKPPGDSKAAEAGADAGVEPAPVAASATAGETGETGETGGEPEPGEAVPTAAEIGEEGGEDDAGAKDDGKDKPEPKDDDGKDTESASAPKIDGKPLFKKKCKSCHGLDGKGETTIGKKVDIPSLVKTKLSKAKVISTIKDGVPDTKMKAYKDKLSKAEIEAVAAYVKKL